MSSNVTRLIDPEEENRKRCAEILVRAAVLIQTALKVNLGNAYPPASKPGEFPAGRTWGGRDAVAWEPTDLATVAKEQRVRIGYRENAWYMLDLEMNRRRLGLQETVKRIMPSLQALGRA